MVFLSPGRDPGFWSGGLQSFDPRGRWAKNLLKIRVSLKIAWKLHDFEKKFGAWRPGPPGPPGSASAGKFIIARENFVSVQRDLCILSCHFVTHSSNPNTAGQLYQWLCEVHLWSEHLAVTAGRPFCGSGMPQDLMSQLDLGPPFPPHWRSPMAPKVSEMCHWIWSNAETRDKGGGGLRQVSQVLWRIAQLLSSS